MRALGICCGASTITVVEVERAGTAINVGAVASKAHEGNPKQVVNDLLSDRGFEAYDRVASTGRKLRHILNLTTISEPLATEQAVAFIHQAYPALNAVVSAGGETFPP